ncbi:MAG: N-acetyl-gamma-glutamyl-phosphate reductase, partial [Algicola sp.]|nr:N-acetyl-gamma-glutamyl-phosphate reductase [Algicola sp.]
YVGKELLTLLANHPNITVAWISSRQLAGQSSHTLATGLDDFQIENLTPEQVGDRQTDIIVLALPNGLAVDFVDALKTNPVTQVIIDLSADYRFDENWTYSLPELDDLVAHTFKPYHPVKISNPGCYATAMQLALAPIKDLLNARPNCFGVSGYSGAGTKPSPNNDPANLKDNLIGYGLIEHLHEKEVSARLQQPVSFSPHVAEFFRGINMTVQVEFEHSQTTEELYQLFENFYADHPVVICQQTIPTVTAVTNTPNCLIGGFSVSEDGKRATIISCLDNLTKGAASQALQNINIALALDPTTSIFLSANNSAAKHNLGETS